MLEKKQSLEDAASQLVNNIFSWCNFWLLLNLKINRSQELSSTTSYIFSQAAVFGTLFKFCLYAFGFRSHCLQYLSHLVYWYILFGFFCVIGQYLKPAWKQKLVRIQYVALTVWSGKITDLKLYLRIQEIGVLVVSILEQFLCRNGFGVQ